MCGGGVDGYSAVAQRHAAGALDERIGRGAGGGCVTFDWLVPAILIAGVLIIGLAVWLLDRSVMRKR